MQASERYLAELLCLDPILATELGLEEGQDRLPDFSPEGEAARADLARQALGWLDAEPDAEPRAARSMRERLRTILALWDAHEPERRVGVIATPQHAIKEALDLMRLEGAEDLENLVARLEAIPAALAGYRATLEHGLDHGHAGQRRQALAAAALADETAAAYFNGLVQQAEPLAPDEHRREALARATARARAAYAELAAYLRDDYAPRADPHDGVGPERWELWCQSANGRRFDPHEAVAWAAEELASLRRTLAREARALGLDAGPGLADALDAMPAYRIEGVEAFLAWNQAHIDAAIELVNERELPIPEPLRRCEAREAPAGGAAAMYYTPPSQDLRRPGRTWYPTKGKRSFALWSELTTVHHESVPGHHLQLGMVTWRTAHLDPFPRLLGATSGHIEGWALYAERLADELGLLPEPAYRIGYLYSQIFRTVRILIDVGLHLGIWVPESGPPAAPLVPERAVSMLTELAALEEPFARSEVDRYLGWPAQATSYKLGERSWLEARRLAEQAGVSRPRFHQAMLELGFVGLDELLTAARALATEATDA